MQSIETKYIGPSNVRGSRVKATASGGVSLTLSWDDALNVEENHNAAARALITKLGWFRGVEAGDRYGDWFSGDTKTGCVYVCAVEYAKLAL
jgi:hypothetical protein